MPFAQRFGGIAAEQGPLNKPNIEHHAINKHTQAQIAAARIARICHRKGFSTPSTDIKLAFEADKITHVVVYIKCPHVFDNGHLEDPKRSQPKKKNQVPTVKQTAQSTNV